VLKIESRERLRFPQLGSIVKLCAHSLLPCSLSIHSAFDRPPQSSALDDVPPARLLLTADCRAALYRLLESLAAPSQPVVQVRVQVGFAAVHVLATVCDRAVELAASAADDGKDWGNHRLSETAAAKEVLLWACKLLLLPSFTRSELLSGGTSSTTTTTDSFLYRQAREKLARLVTDSLIPLRLRHVEAVFGRRVEERLAGTLAWATAAAEDVDSGQ
jgi:hypothetical protein